MNTPNFFSLIPLVACLINAALAVFVLSRNWKSITNQIFFLWGWALSLWNLGTYLSFLALTPEEGLYAVRLLQFGVLSLPFFLFHLCVLIAGIAPKRILFLTYSLHVLFICANFTPLFVKNVRHISDFNAYYAIGGVLFWVFSVVYTILVSSTIFLLRKKLISSTPLQTMKLKSLLIGNSILFIFGSNDILPILGLYHYPFTNTPIYPIGSAAAIFYGIVVSYSVLQNQLLDLQLFVGKIAAKFVSVFLFFLVGLSLLLICSILSPKGSISVHAFTISTLVLLINGIIAGIFLPKLLGNTQDKLERKILGDYFEYQDQVNLFIKTLPWYTKFDNLFDDLELLFIYTLRVAGFRIILLDETGFGFTFFRTYPAVLQREVLRIGADSQLFKVIQETEEDYIVIDKIDSSDLAVCRAELRNSFESEEAELCFPFRSDEVAYGFLLVSRKKSGDVYTRNDIQIITSLVKNLGLVINQIRLKEKLQVEQELDLLGRISKGLAHDLNNLLTPVWTLLQVTSFSESNDPEMESLVDSATQNVRAMRNYIRDSLFFSKTLKPQMTEAKVTEIVHAALGIMQIRAREKDVSLKLNSLAEVIAVLDVVLFQRLVSNLVSNAIDASEAGSVVELDVQSIRRRDDEPSWLQLRVIDHGEGISPANLEKMKAAFFTTKDSGDGKRGFGLGLAICRKIVHLHGGTLNIFSQIGKGTTVQVDLPNGSMPVLIAAERIDESSSMEGMQAL